MPRYPIPTDWDGNDWACVIIEWPNSPQFLGILRGLITTPLRGWFWDEKTGSIIDAQIIGREIEERNPVSSCDEIVAALVAIQQAVENLDVSQDLQVAIQTNIENNISLVATAVGASLGAQTISLVAASVSGATASASAFAWSEAIAKTTSSILIINNTQNQFRPIDVIADPPPTASEETPTGITSVREPQDIEAVCNRAYWLVRELMDFLILLNQVHNNSAKTVLSVAGLLSDALQWATLTVESAAKRFLIPTSVFLSAAHALQDLLFDGTDPFQDLENWIIADYVDIVCEVRIRVSNENTTEQIQNVITASMSNAGLPASYNFIPLLIFNYSSIAGLFYVSPLLDTAPAIPVGEPADICVVCLE